MHCTHQRSCQAHWAWQALLTRLRVQLEYLLVAKCCSPHEVSVEMSPVHQTTGFNDTQYLLGEIFRVTAEFARRIRGTKSAPGFHNSWSSPYEFKKVPKTSVRQRNALASSPSSEGASLILERLDLPIQKRRACVLWAADNRYCCEKHSNPIRD